MTLKYEWKKYIEEMRLHGYAVTIFSPEELEGTSATEAEEWMASCVNDCLEIRRQDNETP